MVDHVDIERRRHGGERRLQERHSGLLVACDQWPDLPRFTSVTAQHKTIRQRQGRLRQTLLQRAQQPAALCAERFAIESEIGVRARYLYLRRRAEIGL